ncbi:helix-turn-helix transcriptional regulator [Arthrobacter sp. USHLN218]|uniref:helix-turn-helix transcriptional regulator n=1 Tax=Arthrobacter sp. USHLN218 TaxID=3081232 RepID=UPI0030192501
MEGFGGFSLVGRDADVRAVVDAVAGTGGALLVADQGLGKTAVSKAVLAELGDGVLPLWIHASPTLSRIPFGALAPYLASLQEDQTNSVLAAMRSVLAHINALAPGQTPVLLVVEDAHDLDESSAMLAAQLVASGAVKLLAMSRTVPAVPPELESLASDGLIVRRPLQPLDSGAALELCRQALGGQILPCLSESLVEASGGNPMFMLALLAQERRDGTLVERNGVWLLTGEPPRPDRRLTDLIKGHFSGCTPQQRQVLETVALADPIPLRLLLDSADGGLVDGLVESRLVTVGEDAERLVRVAHPLYGQVLRAMVPASRSLRLRQQLTPRLFSGRHTLQSLLRQVDWSLECGLPVPASRLLEAARLANGLFNSRFALRAAAAVQPGPYRAAAQVEMAWAHYHNGEFARAEELLAGVLRRARNPATAKSAAVLSAQLLLFRRGGAAGLEGLADEWSATLDRLEAEHPRLAGTPAVVHSRTGCRLLRIRGMVGDEQLAGAETELLQVLDGPEPDPEIELVARTLLAEVYGATGRLVSGAALTRRGLELLHAHEGALLGYYEFVLVPHLTALLRLGEYDDATRELERYAGTGLRGLFYFGGTVALASAALEILQSRPVPGLALLAAAVEGLRQLDLEHLLPLAFAAGAHTAAAAGRNGLAEGYLAGYAEVADQPRQRVRLMCDGLAAAAGFRLRKEPAELDRLFDLVEDARRRGYFSEELDLRVLALRLGSLRGLDQLVKLAEFTEGAAAAQLTALVRALRDEDMPALLRMIDGAASRPLLHATLLSLRSPVLAAEEARGTSSQREFLAQARRQLQKSLPVEPDAGPAGAGGGGRKGGGARAAGGASKAAGGGAAGGAAAGTGAAAASAGGTGAAGAGAAWAGRAGSGRRMAGARRTGVAGAGSAGRPDPGRRTAAPAGAVGTVAAGSAGDMPQAPPVKLTRREHEIGTLVLEGMQNADIAERLGLSVRTVEGHIYRMFAKLHIGSRDELDVAHLG